MTVLLIVPFLVFVGLRVFDLSFLEGDNLIQNFPLRVLVGRDLAHGRLPLWNPYISSGTPLLAGFNAGAAFPLTWLMAVVGDFTAWALTLAIVYDVALAGMYLFLRRHGITSTAATLGAAGFTFSGYLTAQLTHIDLIEAAACLPWMLLAVHGLTEPPCDPLAPSSQRWPQRWWAGVLAVAFGLCLLSGGVEAIIDGTLMVAMYGLGRLVANGWFSGRLRRQLPVASARLSAGVLGGLVLGAAQVLPGLRFQSMSQRAQTTYAFFTSGSLVDRLLTLLWSPFLVGTNQGWPAGYNGTYNFPEVTSYAGVVALIGACSLLLRRWRKRPEARQWWVWYVVLVVGLLAAVGHQTPFGRLLYLIPLYNGQRLLNRNLLLVDTALAVLGAWWLHLVLTTAPVTDRAPSPLAVRWRRGPKSEMVVPALPFCVIAVLCGLLWLDGPGLERWLLLNVPFSTWRRVDLSLLVTVGTVIAGVATWVAVNHERWRPRRLARLLGAVVAADLVVFNVFVIRPPLPDGSALAHLPLATALDAATGNGRFIVYDPDEVHYNALLDLGQTDMNIFAGLASAQGYTALTSNRYYRATGAHLQEDLAPATLSSSTWDELNVTTLLSLPSYFVRPLPGAPSTAVPFPSTIAPARPVAGTVVPSGRAHRWNYGGVLTTTGLAIPLHGGTPGPGGAHGLTVELLDPEGRLARLPPGHLVTRRTGSGSTLEIHLAHPVDAAGVEVQTAPGTTVTVGTPKVDTVQAGTVTLNGPLQRYVTSPRWTYVGTIGPFGVFHDSKAAGWARLLSPDGSPAGPGNTVVAGPPEPSGRQVITVRTNSAAILQRSEANAPGWRATIRPMPPTRGRAGSHSTEPATIERGGVLQKVTIPGPGLFVVTFTYRPTDALWGLGISVAGAGIIAVWSAAELMSRHRRRLARRAGPQAADRTA
ncbi:MAG: hypothetical protein ACYDDZ_10195 [Acidimicrobiales bacterium]